jgi:hypothetical protein
MPLRNRVTPLSELIAVPDRGLVYGNRGCMHDAAGQIRRPYGVLRWIACRLEFRGWQRGPLLQPGKFTELFFLDEATALAAGHRPCALCRRADYNRFLDVWSDLHPDIRGADPIDVQLQAERWDVARRRRRLHQSRVERLPDGAVILRGDEPWVVVGAELLRWTPGGYTDRVGRRRGTATLVTPPSLVALLSSPREPLVPLLHPSAEAG